MNLETALRAAADAIEAGTRMYSWIDATSCNCGVLAQVICGIPDEKTFAIRLFCAGETNRFRGWSLGATET